MLASLAWWGFLILMLLIFMLFLLASAISTIIDGQVNFFIHIFVAHNRAFIYAPLGKSSDIMCYLYFVFDQLCNERKNFFIFLNKSKKWEIMIQFWKTKCIFSFIFPVCVMVYYSIAVMSYISVRDSIRKPEVEMQHFDISYSNIYTSKEITVENTPYVTLYNTSLSWEACSDCFLPRDWLSHFYSILLSLFWVYEINFFFCMNFGCQFQIIFYSNKFTSRILLHDF